MLSCPPLPEFPCRSSFPAPAWSPAAPRLFLADRLSLATLTSVAEGVLLPASVTVLGNDA